VRYVPDRELRADNLRLGVVEKNLFRAAVRGFNPGGDEYLRTRDPSAWPASLKVKLEAHR
jgi:hypothetical protein